MKLHPFSNMTDISVLIVAKKDTEHLMQTINSVVNWTKEVIIIDIGISKEMLSEIKKTTATIIAHDGTVTYADQIRNKITKYASSSYVFFLDPDEVVPNDLQKYIQDNYLKYDALSLPRKNIIFEKWIQHARWWPDHQLRLYKKNIGTWEPEIHSKPVVNGTIHQVEPKEECALIHYNYKNLDHYIEKMTRYAKAEADDYLKGGNTFTLSIALSKGTQEFISRYFAGDGYKDGMHGFVLSFMQLMYYPLVYFYYWEGIKYEKHSQTDLIAASLNHFKDILLQSNHWIITKKLNPSISRIKQKILSMILK